MTLDAQSFARDEVSKLRNSLAELEREPFPLLLAQVSAVVAQALGRSGKVLFCGNGGSAADAQHLAAELVGRQNFHRGPLAGIALTVDTSALTAIANDYGYEAVFSRQVEAVGRPGDVLFAISTSGRSPNVARAVETAGALGIATVAMTGHDPQDLAGADHVIAVPASETAKIQELHIVCGHIICGLVEKECFPPPMDSGFPNSTEEIAGGRRTHP